MIITANDFENALDIIIEMESQMLQAFAGVGDNRLIYVQTSIEEILSNRKEVGLDELMDTFRRFVGATELLEVLKTLRYSKKIQWIGNADEGFTIKKI